MRLKLSYYLLFLSCFYTVIAPGQTDRTDSIMRAISGMSDKEQADTLNALSVFYCNHNRFYQARKAAEEALRLSQTKSLLKEESEAMKNIAEAYWGLNDFQNAIAWYKQATKLNQDRHDRKAEAYCLNATGVSYRLLNNYNEALEFHLKSLTVAEEIGDKERISAAVYSLAHLYHNMHDYKKALKYYKRSFEIDSISGDQYGIALNLNNIGILYLYVDAQGEAKAMACYKRALAIYQKLNDKKGIANMFCNMANIYLKKGDISRALIYQRKSLRFEEELNNLEGIAYSYANIAEIYRTSGDYTKAIQYKEKAMGISTDIELKKALCDSLRMIYTEHKDFQKALYYSLEAGKFKDSLLNSESQRQMIDLQAKYETEKKENQIEILKKENVIESLKVGKQRTYINYFILIVIILILAVLVFIFKYRIRQIREKELEVLVSERTKELLEEIQIRKKAQLEVKQFADELEQKVISRTAELEAAYSELESFSYSVSHDLRAPARRIKGMSQALLEDYSSLLDDTGKDFIARIENSSQEMNQLIEDILNLSRITRKELIKEGFDLSELVQDVYKSIRETDPQREVDLIIQPQVMVSGDRHLLRIVIQNLLDNAWKYTGKTTNPSIQFGRLDQDGKAVIFLHDNGIGFDMNLYEKLFRPFQRLHTAEQFTGTGVGLATVMRIIQKHDGRIWAESETGKGATFFFTLMI